MEDKNKNKLQRISKHFRLNVANINVIRYGWPAKKDEGWPSTGERAREREEERSNAQKFVVEILPGLGHDLIKNKNKRTAFK